MPWRHLSWQGSDPGGTPQIVKYLGPFPWPIYLEKAIVKTSIALGGALPSMEALWATSGPDSPIPGFQGMRPPFGWQWQGPAGTSIHAALYPVERPICDWSPEGYNRIVFNYEGGGVAANDFTFDADVWTP